MLMMIFGKRLSEYVAFAKLFLILVPLVGIVRLALSLNGIPIETVRWVSMTGLGFIGVVYFAIRVHTSGFGSYKQLLVVCALQNWTAQIVAMIGISLAMITGMGNIYSAPEFAFGSDGATWTHLLLHLFVGTTVGSLVPWLFGSVILAATRKLAGTRSTQYVIDP